MVSYLNNRLIGELLSLIPGYFILQSLRRTQKNNRVFFEFPFRALCGLNRMWFRRIGVRFIYIACVVVCCFASSVYSADYDYIDISNPFLKKIPIAVPYFSVASGNPTEKQVSKKAANLLTSALEFTGYFKMLDRESFLINLNSENL